MKLSFIIPTYNNEKTLKECLKSIRLQDFSKKEYEILIIDGGSTDKTLSLAKEFNAKIIKNPKRSEEPARIIGINKSKGEILAFVDADNVLLDKEWIKKMLTPFKDKEISFADTLYFSSRESDPVRVRYQALIGGDDPVVSFLGFYSRWCYFKDNWTDYPYDSIDQGDYFKVSLINKNLVPAMGSNGFVVRKSVLKKFVKNSFIHSDIIYDLINKNFNCFAKVKTGIVHYQISFFKNKIRRMKRRERKEVNIRYNYGLNKLMLAKSFLHVVLILPLIFDIIKGYRRKRDVAWFFHIPASIGLTSIYFLYTIKGLLLR